MTKTHFTVPTGGNACGRPSPRANTEVSRVTCLLCKGTPVWQEAYRAMKEAQEIAFHAQTPRTVVPQFGRVNDDGVMECPDCGGILWRERPRMLCSYHYVCAGCGMSVFPPTETGMCT